MNDIVTYSTRRSLDFVLACIEDQRYHYKEKLGR